MPARRFAYWLVLSLIALHPAGFSRGEVASKSDNAFSVHHEYSVSRPAEVVYEKFIDIGSWWHPDHTWSGDAKNLSLDPTPGGLFVEQFPDGGFSEHMRVIAIQPNRMVRMTGALGPLQEFPVVGVMSISFQSKDEKTTSVTVDYRVSGSFPGAPDAIADAVDRVIGEQFSRLKSASQYPDITADKDIE